MSQCPTMAQLGGVSIPDVLEALRRRGDHYAILNIGLKHLRDNPDDPAGLPIVVKSLLALGLAGPARDLLLAAESSGGLDSEMVSVRDRIATAPAGRVGWRTLQDRFEANFAQVCARWPEMEKHEAVFRDIPRKYELFKSIDDNVNISRRGLRGGRQWVYDFCDVNAVASGAVLPHNSEEMFCGPYLIAGDRSASLFHRVFEATQKMFLTFSPRIYIIESDVASFGFGLYLLDTVDRLTHERVDAFVGPNCVDRLIAYLERHPDRGLPEYGVRLAATGEALCKRAFDALQPLVESRRRKAEDAATAAADYYASLPADYWQTRFGTDRDGPLRVLGLTGRFTTFLQYSMRDWGAAFEDRGHEFKMVLEDSDHDLLPASRIPEAFAEFKPDLVLCIDHFRPKYRRDVPDDVPYVGWIQDALPHLYDRECGKSLGKFDFYIARDARALSINYEYPFAQGVGWPMTTSERTYSNEPMTEEELAPHRCDFSFVSSHSKLPERAHAERRDGFKHDPAVLRLVDRVFETLQGQRGRSVAEACLRSGTLYRAIKRELGFVPASEKANDLLLTTYVYPMAELIFRQSVLAWVADYCDRTGRCLHLYGNGWEEHPRFAQYAHGFAENGPQLRAIHQASTINLQITTFGAVHQRLLDGLAAGGFFLIRRTPGDTAHEVMREFLAAVREYGIQPEEPFDPVELPEFDRVRAKLWEHQGWPEPDKRLTIPTGVIRQLEELERDGFRQVAGAMFEDYEGVSFATAEEFERLAEGFISDRSSRNMITERMRACVVKEYSYGALVDHLLPFIGQRLAESEGGNDGA